LLTLVDCQITYRSRYLVGPVLAPIRDLVVLDTYNPRSVAFQVEALNAHIASLPALVESGLIERPQRLAVAAQSSLTTAEAGRLDTKTLFSLEQDLLNLADAIGAHYFPHGPNATRPAQLPGLPGSTTSGTSRPTPMRARSVSRAARCGSSRTMATAKNCSRTSSRSGRDRRRAPRAAIFSAPAPRASSSRCRTAICASIRAPA